MQSVQSPGYYVEVPNKQSKMRFKKNIFIPLASAVAHIHFVQTLYEKFNPNYQTTRLSFASFLNIKSL